MTQLEEVKDRDELRSFLMNDRLATAYLLGNLDPAYFQWCQVFGTRDIHSKLSSLVMIYSGLSLPVVFTAGAEDEACRIFEEQNEVLPKRFQFHVSTNQLEKLESRFQLADKRKMIRMGLTRDTYTPVDCDTSEVHQLGHRDTAAIMDIYQYYPDHLFEAYQLETGYYYGIPNQNDGLKSIAGIHVFTEENDIALIGNFVTHPDFRSKGLATACTSLLLEALLQRVSYVALNVPANNDAAFKLFEKFGFRLNNVFHQGVVDSIN